MTRLTAAQARELAGPTVSERVDEVLKQIKEVASPPTRARRLNLMEPFWANGGYGNEKNWTEAKKQLEDLGYKVTFFYEERQFVNMFTVVEW